MIYLGDRAITGVYVGDEPVDKIYYGGDAIDDGADLMPPVPRKYWAEVDYSDDPDYTLTRVEPYKALSDAEAAARKDATGSSEPYDYRPYPVYVRWRPVDGATGYTVTVSGTGITWTFTAAADKHLVEVYNLIPGRTYSYSVAATVSGVSTTIASGTFETAGARRFILAERGRNIRDIGGLSAENGKTVKYGLVYRGGQLDGQNNNLTDVGRHRLVDQVGVVSELDFRNEGEGSGALSDYNRVPLDAYTSAINSDKAEYAAAFGILLDNLTAEPVKPTYIHCAGGADRTGTFIWLIEALLGVSESDCSKDYELTSFRELRTRLRSGFEGDGAHPNLNLKGLVTALRTEYGADKTAQELAEAYWDDAGISAANIATFKAIMLEEGGT